MAERRRIVGRVEVPVGGRTRDSYTTQVVANPTDIGALPGPSRGELEGLFDGLATFDKGLGKYMAEQQRKEAEAGRAARLMGENLGEDQGTDFAHGYMAMDMTVKGDQDGAAIADAYRTSFNPDADNFDDWLAKQYGERVNGMDPQFRAHYDKTISEHVAKLRAEHTRADLNRTATRIESNALFILDKHVGAMVQSGNAIDGPGVEALRVAVQRLGLGSERFNTLLFEAIKKYGDAGHPSVYEALKADRPDGSPGLYYSPEWKAKIDAAEQAATTRFLAARKDADERLRKDRDEMQEQEVGKVLLLESDEDVREGFARLVRSGVVQRASDIDRFQRIVESRIKREAAPEQKEAEDQLLVKIYTGKAGPMDILRAAGEGRITPAQRAGAIREWYRVKADARRDAATAQAGEDPLRKRFNNPLVRQGFRVLDGLLNEFNKEELANGEDLLRVAKERRLEAEVALTRAIASGEVSPEKSVEHAQALVKQFSQRATQLQSPPAPAAPQGGAKKAPPPPKVFRTNATAKTAAQIEAEMRALNIPIPQ